MGGDAEVLRTNPDRRMPADFPMTLAAATLLAPRGRSARSSGPPSPTSESALNDGFILRGPRQPRSTPPPYRGRPAIIFGSAFVVPAAAETEQVSPDHGQPDLHRDRFEWTACLARSSSPNLGV